MKLISWNVNGIRAVTKKGFNDFLKSESPDILFLQETKAQKDQLDESILNPDGYSTYWHSAVRKGYSSVALYTKTRPIDVTLGCGIKEFDEEGRVIRAEYDDFIIYGIYFPNGGRAERLPYKFDFSERLLKMFIKDDKNKNVIVCGDFNVAHEAIDLARPKENVKTSGFLPEERAWFSKLLSSGFIDTYRYFYPDEIEKYTFWDQRFRARDRNIGWRIDYFIVSERMIKNVSDAFIYTDIFGSDHCPVGIKLDF